MHNPWCRCQACVQERDWRENHPAYPYRPEDSLRRIQILEEQVIALKEQVSSFKTISQGYAQQLDEKDAEVESYKAAYEEIKKELKELHRKIKSNRFLGIEIDDGEEESNTVQEEKD